MLADAGYVSEENFARADTGKLRLLAPLAKDPGRAGGRPPKRARHLEEYPATARAIRRMRHPRGREDYKLRARTVEPVFGQLKTCQKLTTMFCPRPCRMICTVMIWRRGMERLAPLMPEHPRHGTDVIISFFAGRAARPEGVM